MSELNAVVVVGRVKDAHGLKGEIFVRLKAGRADWLDRLEYFILRDQKGHLLEIEPQRVRAHKDGLICHPLGWDNRDLAEAWRGADVLIPSEYIVSEDGDRPFLGQFLGLEVMSKEGEALGKVVALKSNGPQDLLELETPRGLALVPLVEPFIVAVDWAKRKLTMDLPEGLLP